MLNPCVLPILPIVAASALQRNKTSPVFIALGLSVSTCLAGFFVALVGPNLGIRQSAFSNFGALFLIMFGILILLPTAYSPFYYFSSSVAGISGWTSKLNGSHAANTVAGAALGLAWSPCIGPTMGMAVALASTGENLSLSFAIMLAYGAGIGTIVLLLSYGGRTVISSRKEVLKRHSRVAFLFFGLISILVGLMILSKTHEIFEAWLLGIMPMWLVSLSVKF